MTGYKVSFRKIDENWKTSWSDCFEGFVKTKEEAEEVCKMLHECREEIKGISYTEAKIIKHEKKNICNYTKITPENFKYTCYH